MGKACVRVDAFDGKKTNALSWASDTRNTSNARNAFSTNCNKKAREAHDITLSALRAFLYFYV